MNEVIGSAEAALDRKGDETLLGNWQTDVMREFAKADVAFHNRGGMRADLEKGPVTLRDIYLVSPFENTIVTMDLSGEEIKAMLERGLSGGFGPLQVSGLKIVYDPSRPRGQRVLEVSTGGKPLEPRKIYKAATNSFVASGGDDYLGLKAKNLRDTGVNLRDAEVDFIRKRSPISARIEGRIVAK